MLAVAFRLVQGFALGGEIGPSTAFLLEAAPPDRRALYVSLQYVTQDLAIFASGLAGLILSWMPTAAELDAIGWRLAFLLGAVVIPFGLVLRRQLVEVMPQAEDGGASRPTRSVGWIAGAALLLLAGGTVSQYTLNYLTTYAQATLGLGTHVAFGSTLIVGILGASGSLASGWLADRIGRRPLLLAAYGLLLLITVPTFALMAAARSPGALWSGSVLLTLIVTAANTPALVLISESLPPRQRAGSLGLVYALSIAIFGGSAQFVEAWLSRLTGSSSVPGVYMSVMVLIALSAALTLPETRPSPEAASRLRTSPDRGPPG